MMNPHRIHGETIPNGKPLDPGPAKQCQACRVSRMTLCTDGIFALDYPLRCHDGARIWTGFFRRCKEPGEHLHEHCRACDHRWITAFAGST